MGGELETIDLDENFDKEFLLGLMDRHHKDFVKALNAVTSALNKDRDKELITSISKYQESIKSIISEIKNIPTPEIKIENIELKTCIEEMEKKITDKLEELKNIGTKEWEFKVVRNYGQIEKIIATAKK